MEPAAAAAAAGASGVGAGTAAAGTVGVAAVAAEAGQSLQELNDALLLLKHTWAPGFLLGAMSCFVLKVGGCSGWAAQYRCHCYLVLYASREHKAATHSAALPAERLT